MSVPTTAVEPDESEPQGEPSATEHEPQLLDRRRIARSLGLPPALMLGGLVLLILAQLQHQHQQLTPLSVLALAAGLALWCGALALVPTTGELLAEARSLPLQRLHLGLLAGALVLAAVTYARTGENQIRREWFVPWLLACGLWIAAWWPLARAGSARGPLSDRERYERLVHLLTLAAIVAFGAFLRLHRATITPAEPTSDHAEKLLDMTDLLNGQRPLFLERNTGREPMQFYFTLALMKWFRMPRSYDTLKFGTALIDTLAIPSVYLLAAELAGRRVGLIAAFLYSISKWAISMALIGLRVSYAPLFAALLIWALLRYFRTGERRDALLVGIFLGLGLYGYTPFRICVVLVPLCFLLLLLFDRRWRRRRFALIGHGLVAAATAVLIFLPMLHFMQARPDLFWERANSRLIGDPQAGQDASAGALESFINKFPVFLHNNRNALLAFNWRGDSTAVNAVTYDPIVDPITAAALLAGVLIVVVAIVRRRSLRYAMLLLSVPVLLLATTLSLAFPEENPSVNRMITTAPAIMTIAALPLAWLIESVIRLRGRWQPVLAWLCVGVMLWLATSSNYLTFFRDFHRQYLGFVRNNTEAIAAVKGARAVGVLPENAYHVSYPHWFDTRLIGFGLDDPTWADTHAVVDQPLPEAHGKAMLFLININDSARVDEAKARWPTGVVTVVPSRVPGMEFLTFYVPVGAEEHVPLPPPQSALVDGQEVLISTSPLDQGSVPDLFDLNPESLIRGKEDNPFVLELEFPTPRVISTINLTVASMDLQVTTIVTTTTGERLEQSPLLFQGLPPDPTVTLTLGGAPVEVQRLRLEITHLNPNPPDEVHVHVRELTLR